MPASPPPRRSRVSGRPPRCLLVTKEFALRPTSGGTLRTLALVQQLSTHYDTTTIAPAGVFTSGPGRPLTEHGHRTPPPPGARAAARPGTPAVLRYGSLGAARTAGTGLLNNLWHGAEGRYETGIIDHTCLAGLARTVASGCDLLAVSMHNIESDLMRQRAAAARSPGAALLMRAEAALLRRLERRVVEAGYPVLVCTEADARALGGASVIVGRNGIFPPAAQARAGGQRARSMVFAGALDWEPNVEGVTWFLNRVWPLVRARVPAVALTVAGRRPGAGLIEACRAGGVRLVSDPPVMAAVLATHQLGVVPLLSGGGSRIKILEYLSVGLDVVSTELGAAGLEDIPARYLTRVAARPELLAEAVIGRLEAPTGQGTQAQDWVAKNYAWEVTLQPLLDRLIASGAAP